MNVGQGCVRLKNILRSLRWDGTGDPVFGRESVVVSQMPLRTFLDQLVMPAAFVGVGTAQADPEDPRLVKQGIPVTIVSSVPGDMLGERPLIGANRASKTAIGNRGLVTEIEPQVMAAIAQLNASGQFRITLQYQSAVGVQYDDDTGYMAWREYGFEAFLTTKLEHQAPRQAGASAVAGTVTVSWTVPDVATNLVSYVVRRVVGSIPAGFPDDGTDVPWTSGTSVADTPGSGIWTYSVFATYDDLGGSVPHDFSDYASVTIEVP